MKVQYGWRKEFVRNSFHRLSTHVGSDVVVKTPIDRPTFNTEAEVKYSSSDDKSTEASPLHLSPQACSVDISISFNECKMFIEKRSDASSSSSSLSLRQRKKKSQPRSVSMMMTTMRSEPSLLAPRNDHLRNITTYFSLQKYQTLIISLSNLPRLATLFKSWKWKRDIYIHRGTYRDRDVAAKHKEREERREKRDREKDREDVGAQSRTREKELDVLFFPSTIIRCWSVMCTWNVLNIRYLRIFIQSSQSAKKRKKTR